jgi:transposase
VGERRRKFDQDFQDGAVRIVRETGKPIAQVARELGVNEGPLGTGWRWTGSAARTAAARWIRTSGRSWRGCAARWSNWP